MIKEKNMKRQYIQPNTEICQINLNGSILTDQTDPTLTVGQGSQKMYGTSMDSNQSGFDDEEDFDLSSNTSLWDD